MSVDVQPVVLRVRALRHRYRDTVALGGVDLDVSGGECVALLGPNGAGKTTLVNLAIGLMPRQDGEIRLAGGDPRVAVTRRRLGVVHQGLGFPNTLKVGELVVGAAVRGGRPRSAAGPIMAELELTELAGRRAVKLSGGQQQRLRLAMALVTDPALLVLDEPTTGLDAVARRRFWRILAERRARGVGVLVTTHLIEESAVVADRVIVLDHGRVVATGRPDELIARLPDRTVIVRTAVDHDRLATLPGVLSTSVDGELVRLRTRTPEALLRVLLAQDPGLADLRVETAGLAEAVIGLTEQTGRVVAA
jgi:ABC-2 type transport system ATP-binding protein